MRDKEPMGERLQAVAGIEREHPGLIIDGNLRDSIGMGHRMTQAAQIASHIVKQQKN